MSGEAYQEGGEDELERSMLEEVGGVTLAGSANRRGGVFDRLSDPVLASPDRRSGMAREYRRKYRQQIKLTRRVLH
jgi:hypothetical protein